MRQRRGLRGKSCGRSGLGGGEAPAVGRVVEDLGFELGDAAVFEGPVEDVVVGGDVGVAAAGVVEAGDEAGEIAALVVEARDCSAAFVAPAGAGRRRPGCWPGRWVAPELVKLRGAGSLGDREVGEEQCGGGACGVEGGVFVGDGVTDAGAADGECAAGGGGVKATLASCRQHRRPHLTGPVNHGSRSLLCNDGR